MDDEQTFESEKLYMRGMAQLRAAQWQAAVETLSELSAISSAYSDVDALIADALLKVEIERLRAPDGLAPPKSDCCGRAFSPPWWCCLRSAARC